MAKHAGCQYQVRQGLLVPQVRFCVSTAYTFTQQAATQQRLSSDCTSWVLAELVSGSWSGAAAGAACAICRCVPCPGLAIVERAHLQSSFLLDACRCGFVGSVGYWAHLLCLDRWLSTRQGLAACCAEAWENLCPHSIVPVTSAAPRHSDGQTPLHYLALSGP